MGGARQFIPRRSAGITILAKSCLELMLQARFLKTASQTCASPSLGERQFIPRGSVGITILAKLRLDFTLQAAVFQRQLRKFAPVTFCPCRLAPRDRVFCQVARSVWPVSGKK